MFFYCTTVLLNLPRGIFYHNRTSREGYEITWNYSEMSTIFGVCPKCSSKKRRKRRKPHIKKRTDNHEEKKSGTMMTRRRDNGTSTPHVESITVSIHHTHPLLLADLVLYSSYTPARPPPTPTTQTKPELKKSKRKSFRNRVNIHHE